MTAQLFRAFRLPIFLVLFVLVDLVSLALLVEQAQPINFETFGDETAVGGGRLSETAYIPKLSEIEGPKIDPQAASIVIETACTTLPVNLWVFLLFCYVALLVFNLFYGFRKSVLKDERRFVWEIFLTVLTLLAWSQWDTCGELLWFPIAVVKYGLLTYVCYLYFFEKERRHMEKAQ